MAIELVIALASIGSTTLGGIIGFITGKRKRSVELSTLEVQLLLRIRDDNNRQLGYYIKLSEDLLSKVEGLEKTIDAILEDVCIKKNCRYRIYHSSIQAKREMERVLKEKEEEDSSEVN